MNAKDSLSEALLSLLLELGKILADKTALGAEDIKGLMTAHKNETEIIAQGDFLMVQEALEEVLSHHSSRSSMVHFYLSQLVRMIRLGARKTTTVRPETRAYTRTLPLEALDYSYNNDKRGF
ncbi:MAG: hypothetical protein IPL25_12375 [Saprospiraceae bacterium]|nr:hypothetical protein [Candidatus Vicinibacter affinis]